MYKKLTGDDYRKIFKFPKDYRVDGVLVRGAMRKKKHRQELEDILAALGYKTDFGVIYESGFYENVIVLELNGKKIWFDVSYGGAYTCELIHLGSLLGSKKNILVGSCGGLSLSGQAGDLVIPLSSYGNESTTRMYQPDNDEFMYFSDQALSKMIKARVGSDYKVIEGKLMTCQAALMESEDDVQRWSQEGFVGVEMESATVFAVSNYFKVPCSAILFIADNIVKNESLFGEEFERKKSKLDKARFETFKVAFEEILS